jgi:hypothetical protein
MTGPITINADRARELLRQCKQGLFVSFGAVAIFWTLIILKRLGDHSSASLSDGMAAVVTAFLIGLPVVGAGLFLSRLSALVTGLGRSPMLWAGVPFIVAFLALAFVGPMIFTVVYFMIRRVVRETFTAAPGAPVASQTGG